MARRWGLALAAVLQDEQDASARGIGDGVERPIKRIFGRHGDYRYRGNRWMSIYDYFFRIGLYPSPCSRVRMASASLTSA